MTAATGDFDLTIEELRIVARYAVEAAAEVLTVFENSERGDERPRNAITAAWTFVDGAPRSTLQRVASLDAHRAAREAGSEAARRAAQAAGDAAAAAYLHPLATSTQVGHILRAAANAARVAELEAGDDPAAAERAIGRALDRATPALIDILLRYPAAPAGKSRVAHLMTAIDSRLRAAR